jgi:hypothetical protein
MKPATEKYNHITKEFSKLVDDHFPKLNILNYYPYGSRIIWKHWLTGEVNLKKVYLDDRNKDKTANDYISNIKCEVARAMNYLMVYGNYHWFDRQRIEAFSLWRLFHSGDYGWTKKPLKGLTDDEKIKLYKKYQKKSNMLYPEETQKKLKIDISVVQSFLKKHGVYEVRHFPLISYGPRQYKKPLYTIQQLAAIELMVDCAFENLC